MTTDSRAMRFLLAALATFIIVSLIFMLVRV
jgi:hypothetical protein